MKKVITYFISVMVVLLTGCAATVPTTPETVYYPTVKREPVPAAYLSPCLMPDLPDADAFDAAADFDKVKQLAVVVIETRQALAVCSMQVRMVTEWREGTR